MVNVEKQVIINGDLGLRLGDTGLIKSLKKFLPNPSFLELCDQKETSLPLCFFLVAILLEYALQWIIRTYPFRRRRHHFHFILARHREEKTTSLFSE